MSKSRLLYIAMALIIITIGGCTGTKVQQVAIIRIKGSDTMLPLTRMLAEEYMLRNPGTSIYVEGGGTSSGVKSLIQGKIDLCTASRTLKTEESKMLADYYGSLGMFYLIAKDALSIYVNPDNPVNNLTKKQLKDIFTCRVVNWEEVGGINSPIKIINRNFNSGTYSYFKEHILEGEEYCENSSSESTTEDVIKQVKDNINAIGYGGINYGGDIKLLAVDGVSAAEENARNDKYPITRYLHFFTTRSPAGAVKDFIDWTLSPEGQKIIKEAGYIPLWQITT